MNKPKVSVCIANYNGEHIIEGCIQSVLAQDFENVEIIIHDDCSTDNSLDVISRFSEQVVLLKSEQNIGYCLSNNRMLEKSSGHYVLLLNNDAALGEGAISALVKAHQQGGYAILTLKQMSYDGEQIIDYGCAVDFSLTPRGIDTIQDNTVNIDFGHGACLFFEYTLIQSFGFFPVEFNSLAEDLYFCLYARSNKLHTGCLTSHYYQHKSGYSFGGGSADESELITTLNRRYLSERNRLAIMRIHFPDVLKLLLLPSILILIIEMFAMMLKSKSVTKVMKTYTSAIFHGMTLKLTRDTSWRLSHKTVWSFGMRSNKFKLLMKYGMPQFRSY